MATAPAPRHPNEANPILDTDSYKASHWLQYPPRTTNVFSYIESRGGKHPETVFFGLQYIMKRNLETPITEADVAEAEEFFAKHGEPFNAEGFRHIVQDHDGLFQVRIRAVPEGSVVPVSNCLCSVENTCPECFWVTSWIETMLLRVWYPITVATESRAIKKIIRDSLLRTADDADAELPFKLHDFGARGVSSRESASIGGAAHLVNFMGSDTVVGVALCNDYYKSDMAAFSVPAAEHSTITAWGKEREADAYRHVFRTFAQPGKIVSIVSDSYDIFNACEHIYGETLKREIVESGATLVVRPDSGDPPTVVLKCLEILGGKFGTTINSKGFKVLNNVRILQGDGVDAESITAILSLAEQNKFSASNIVFGMGGALLQKHHRDTQKFAMKCSFIVADGKPVDVFKAPVTDPGKKSKRGRLDLVRNAQGQYETVVLDAGMQAHPNSVLKTVFLNGKVVKEYTLDEVRANAKLT